MHQRLAVNSSVLVLKHIASAFIIKCIHDSVEKVESYRKILFYSIQKEGSFFMYMNNIF